MFAVDAASRIGAQPPVRIVGATGDALSSQINAYASFLVEFPRIPRLTQSALYGPEDSKKRVQLPIELIQHIVTLSIPPPRFDNRNRCKFLLPLCLLTTTLRRSIQRELFRHPVLEGQDVVKLFLRTIEEGDEVVKGWITSLRFGRTAGVAFAYAEDDLRRILVACARVEELWLQNVADVRISSLAHAKHLRSLYCWGGSIIVDSHTDFASTPPSLQKLENLSLSGVSIITTPSSPHLFTPNLLPALCRLSIYLVDIDDLGCSPSLHLTPIASQLRHLSITDSTPSYPDFVTECINLVALDCNVNVSTFATTPDGFYRPLRFLRVGYRDPHDAIMFAIYFPAAVESGLVETGTKVFLGWPRALHNHYAGHARALLDGRIDGSGTEVEFAGGDLSRSWVENREDFAGPFWNFSRWADKQEVLDNE